MPTDLSSSVKFELPARAWDPTTEKWVGSILKAQRGADGHRRLQGVASSSTKDLHGDVMLETALDDMLQAANQNLTIFLNHSYNVPEDVGGSVEAANLRINGVDQAGNPNVELTYTIKMNEANPRAIAAWEAVESGTKLGLSIGAAVPDGGAKRNKDGTWIIEHVTLLETSIVGVPANPKSWLDYAVKALDASQPATHHFKANGVEVEVLDSAPAEVLEKACPTCGGVKGKSGCDDKYHTAAAEPEVQAGGTVTAAQTITVGEAGPETVLAANPETPAVTPEVTDAKVNISIDTESGSSPSQAAPEPQGAQAERTEAGVLDETASGDNAALGDTVTNAVTDLDVSASLVDLLRTATDKLAAAMAGKTKAEIERDAAVAERDRVVNGTRELLNRLAETPLVRKTAVVAAEGEFRQKFASVYGDEYLTYLENSQHE